MTNKVLSRKAVLAQGAVMTYLAPKLAQDAKIDLAPVFDGVSAKNFKAKKPDMVAAIKDATKGKLAQDASLEDVTQLLDALEGAEVMEGADTDPNSGLPMVPSENDDTTMDAGPAEKIKAFLKGKISDEDLAKIDALCAAPAASDEDDEEKRKAEEAARAKDEAEKKDMVTKPAMDAAIAAAVKAATDQATKNQIEIRDAERAVRPYVGDLAMAHDSAESVYRTALKTLGVDIEGVHGSALPAILKAQPVPGAKPAAKPALAADAAAVKSFSERYPEAARIGRA